MYCIASTSCTYVLYSINKYCIASTSCTYVLYSINVISHHFKLTNAAQIYCPALMHNSVYSGFHTLPTDYFQHWLYTGDEKYSIYPLYISMACVCVCANVRGFIPHSFGSVTAVSNHSNWEEFQISPSISCTSQQPMKLYHT